MTLTREQAREYVNSLLPTELKRAKKTVNGKNTYICPECGNGSGSDGDGICTRDGSHYKCFKCGFYGDYLDILKNRHVTDNEGEIFARYNIMLDNIRTCPSSNHGQSALPTQSQPEQPVDYTYFFYRRKKTYSAVRLD